MDKKLKIVYFASYFPHYRLGVYKILGRAEKNLSFTFCAPEDSPGTFLNASHKSVEFDRRFVRLWKIPIPFTSNAFSIQPYAVWCMLSGKFNVFIMGNDVLRVF